MLATGSAAASAVRVDNVTAAAYTIPTDRPESDGTFSWDSTTIVIAEARGGGQSGIGWTYAPASVARMIGDMLAPVVEETTALDIGATNLAMRVAMRNAGVPGAGAMAISAVDIALWDLKAKLLGVPLAALLGPVHEEVPIYGSGGSCSYSTAELAEQLSDWVDEGIPRVKMKVGRDPDIDVVRVEAARRAVGDHIELYVDANGALSRKESLRFAAEFAELGVRWFEEPVSSRDLDGLRLIRDRAPAGMDIAAGDYASRPTDFLALAGVVDCLQVDATRCGGITGLLGAAALAEAHELDVSGHSAPTIHAHVLCAVAKVRHVEWFHDHVRIERLLFDGFLEPEDGAVRPDLSRPGLGLGLNREVAEAYAV